MCWKLLEFGAREWGAVLREMGCCTWETADLWGAENNSERIFSDKGIQFSHWTYDLSCHGMLIDLTVSGISWFFPARELSVTFTVTLSLSHTRALIAWQGVS